MLFAVLVVEGDVLLQAVDDRLVVDHDLRRIVREGGDHDFQHVEQPARIAAAETEDRFLFLEGDIPGFQVVILLYSTLQKRVQVAYFQLFKHIYLTAGEEGSDHLERGVFRGGADQRDDAAFHRTEQRILLRFIETVDFVDKEDRGVDGEHPAGFGPLDHFPDILDAGTDGGEGIEFAAGFAGYDARQRGFSHARRAPENE